MAMERSAIPSEKAPKKNREKRVQAIRSTFVRTTHVVLGLRAMELFRSYSISEQHVGNRSGGTSIHHPNDRRWLGGRRALQVPKEWERDVG